MNSYSEYQALGYLVIALEALGKSENEIKKIIYKMRDEMEVWTEEHAEETYEKFLEG